jgi:hypothetical protein
MFGSGSASPQSYSKIPKIEGKDQVSNDRSRDYLLLVSENFCHRQSDRAKSGEEAGKNGNEDDEACPGKNPAN